MRSTGAARTRITKPRDSGTLERDSTSPLIYRRYNPPETEHEIKKMLDVAQPLQAVMFLKPKNIRAPISLPMLYD